MSIPLNDHFHILQMTFDCLPTWRDDRFETKRFANRVPSCVGFTDFKLSDGPAQEIEAHLPLVGLERMGDSGFTGLEFQSHGAQPCFQ